MTKRPYIKTALTYQEQLELLKGRGLVVEDDVKALHLLEAVSYYRLSGYWYPLLADKPNHTFKSDASFETAFNLYKFDRELRLLVLRELEKIEVSVRAKMIYILSHSRGSLWYAVPSNFRNHGSHAKTLERMKEEFERSDEQFIYSFKAKYNDPMPPSWIMMEISSFGALSHLYSNLVPGMDKRKIAKFYGINDRTFKSWLHSIVYLRNLCAHHSRLWNRTMSIAPNKPRNTEYQWLDKESVPNNKVYFVLSMIVYLLKIINPKQSVPYKLKDLLSKYPNVDTSAMGFPENWESEPLWETN